MKAFLNHFSFEFRSSIRNRSLLFLTYLFPLLVYGLLGTLMTSVNPFFGKTMIPAMVIFAILSSTLLALPDPLVTARKAGIFRSYRINGVPAASILLIPALSTLLHLLVIAAVITFSAPALFHAPLPANWPAFLLTLVVTVLAFTGLALLIGVVSSTSQMTVFMSQAVFLPSMILGGLMVPTSILPPALARFAMLLPTTHAMRAFTGLGQGLEQGMGPWWALATLAAGAVLAIGLALYLFTWDSTDPRLGKRAPLALLALLPYAIALVLFS